MIHERESTDYKKMGSIQSIEAKPQPPPPPAASKKGKRITIKEISPEEKKVPLGGIRMSLMKIQVLKQQMSLAVFEMLLADFFLRLSLHLSQSQILLFQTGKVIAFSSLLYVHHHQLLKLFFALATFIVAGLTDTYNCTVIICIVSCVFGFFMLIVTVIFQVLFSLKMIEQEWLFFIFNNVVNYFLLFEPARIIVIFDIVATPRGYKIFRFICASLVWMRELAFIANFGFIYLYKDLPLFWLLCVVLAGGFLTIYLIALIYTTRTVLQSNPYKSNIVIRMMKYCCRCCKTKKSEDKKLNFSKRGYTEEEKFSASYFMRILWYISPFIFYFIVYELLITVWDFHLDLDNHELNINPNYISSAIMISTINLINIPLIELVLTIYRRMKLWVLTDFRLMGAAIFFILISLMFTFVLNIEIDTLPLTIPPGRSQMNFFNALPNNVTIQHELTGPIIIESYSKVNSFNFDLNGYEALSLNVSSESLTYSKTVVAAEQKSVFLLITDLGLVRISGFQELEFEPRSMEPNLAKVAILNAYSFYGQSLVLNLENNATLHINLPRMYEENLIYLQGSKYTLQDQDEPWQKIETGNAYALFFYKDNSSKIRVWQETYYDFVKETESSSLGMYFISLGSSIELVTLKHFLYLQSPKNIRNLSFAILIFYETLGVSVFYVIAACTTLTTNLIAVFLVLYVMNVFYFLIISAEYQPINLAY